jgi:putative ABC transport system permease protein
MMRIPRWLRWRTDKELDEEIAAHLDLEIQANLDRGLTLGEARAAALRRFGSRARVGERTRESDPLFVMSQIWSDLKHEVRSLVKRPGIGAAVVGSLALGIGANTMIFSVVNAVLLRSLPFPDADRLVAVWFTPSTQPDRKTGTNPLGYFTIRDDNHVFESVGAARLTAAFNVGEDSENAGARFRVPAQWFTFGMTNVLGVNPVLGRWPSQDEPLAIVISDGLWRRLFGAAPDVLGKKLRIDAFVVTVVGVMSPGFELVSPADFWLFQTDEALRTALRSNSRIYTLTARLKPGVTLEQAQAEMTRLAPFLAELMPETHTGWTIRVESLHDVYVAAFRTPLLVFQGAVFFVLLIACANVAGLLLSQASTRHRELVLRSALGASRRRIVGQLLTESLLLAGLGGASGVALSWAGLRVFTNLSSGGLPASSGVTLDSSVLGFTLLISIGSGVIFGVVPALQLSRPHALSILRASGRGVTGAGQLLRSAFVVVQVALALVLFVGAGLLINSFVRLGTVQPGFDTRHLTTFQVPFPRSFYTWDGNTSYEVELTPRIDGLSESIRERLSTIPGVESATLTVTPPLGGEPPRMEFAAEDRLAASSERQVFSAEWYPTGLAYFRTLKIPLLGGREFEASDTDRGRPVAIISTTMARTFWPGEEPIGKRIQLNLPYDPPREIVGIVGDVRQSRYQRNPEPQLYVPRAQLPRRMAMTLSQQIMLLNTFVVRVRGDAAQMTPHLQTAVTKEDPTQVIINVRTVDQYAMGQLKDLREYTVVLTLFGVISVVLAGVGVYAVVSHGVIQRSREIGIRMALGAHPATVLRLVLGQGMLIIAVGAAVGVCASLILTRVIGTLLWGVTPTDPLTFILVLLALSFIGLVACYVPARRASRIDPLVVLNDG